VDYVVPQEWESFTDEDHAVWDLLFARQVELLGGRVVSQFLDGIDLLRLSHPGVPDVDGLNAILEPRTGWRTVYQSTAHVETDAPSDWRTFWRQQLRWGRSSQRETLLSLRWLWRRPVAFATFATDIVTPFALYAVIALGVAHALGPGSGLRHLALPVEVVFGYVGMLVSIGVRQIPHLRRRPRDVLRLPVFVLQLTFVMVPIRILAFATMLHQSWSTRPAALPYEFRNEAVLAESGHG